MLHEYSTSFRAIVVDIEATNLKADFGIVIAAGVMVLPPIWEDSHEKIIRQWLETMDSLLRKEPVRLPSPSLLTKWGIKVFRIDDDPEFYTDNTNDKHVIERLFEEIKRAHIVLGYNTDRFDIKFLRSRAVYHGIDFPTGFYHGDIYKAVRQIYTLHNKSLDSVAAHLGLSLKTPVRAEIWINALNVGKKGKEARNYITAHLIFDLLTTAWVYGRVWKTVKIRQVLI